MARYKAYSYEQAVFLPIKFENQILPGSLEEAISKIVDEYIDLSVFEARYKNDVTGAPAFDPGILLKIVLLAYSRGIISSRDIERACRENILFMAISADSHPDHSTIAEFVSSMENEIISVFRDVLMICDELGLIGGTMLAIDGCKLRSNASKEWSGTKADFKKKQEKFEKTIKLLLAQHSENDKSENAIYLTEDEKKKRIEKLEAKIKKLKAWISKNEDKPGANGHIKKSNITDNESAKMPSAHGVVQGYNGIAAVDSKHQIVLDAEAYPEISEQKIFKDVIEKTEGNLLAIGKDKDFIKKAKVLTDSGFHSKDSVAEAYEEGLDAYMPDKGFRKRDPRFNDAIRHKEHIDKNRQVYKKKYFGVEEFKYDEEKKKLICPAGCELYVKNSNYEYHGKKAIAYMGAKTNCRACNLRSKCIRGKRVEARQVHIFYGSDDIKDLLVEEMKQKIDTNFGRHIYSQRMKIIEPVFGNLRWNIGLDKFTLRGEKKVNVQWKLFAIIQNIGKIWRYGFAMA